MTLASVLCGVAILTGVVAAWRNASAVQPINANAPSGEPLTPAALSRRGALVLLTAIAATTAVIACAFPARADRKPVDLLLVLAADVPYIVNDEEAKLQRPGYAATAVTIPSVLSPIAKNPYGRLGIYCV